MHFNALAAYSFASRVYYYSNFFCRFSLNSCSGSMIEIFPLCESFKADKIKGTSTIGLLFVSSAGRNANPY